MDNPNNRLPVKSKFGKKFNAIRKYIVITLSHHIITKNFLKSQDHSDVSAQNTTLLRIFHRAN